jgi:signal transduction histidine kinase
LYALDEALMRNIVGNLLSNAVKYSPQGGNVRLSVTEQPDQITLEVRDEGIGIPLDDQSRLYQSFHRASNVGSIAGTGLGLSIVKEAVLCHKGSIAVDSVVGRGSCFTVMLPTSKSMA